MGLELNIRTWLQRSVFGAQRGEPAPRHQGRHTDTEIMTG